MPTLKIVTMDSMPYLNETWPTVWSSSITELRTIISGLTGLLPTTMSNMTNIRILDLSYNPTAMNGSFPSFILNMTSLEYLGLGANGISSPLPDLCVFTNMTELSLFTNYINTPFPNVSCLTKLQALSLGSTSIYGSIPSDLPSNLRALNLMNNRLEGEIPQGLLGLQWTEFSVSNNRCVCPCSFFCEFYLVPTFPTCRLNGSLPSAMFNLTDLLILRLGGNDFFGSCVSFFSASPCASTARLTLPAAIPANIAPKRLYRLELDGNGKITGTIPENIGNWSSLFTFSFDDTGIHGTLPDSIGSCSSLSTLTFSNTAVSGAAPESMRSLAELKALVASNTSIFGPSWLESLASLSNLYLIDLRNNRLLGAIPEGFGTNLTEMKRLLLGRSGLNGTIPSSFAGMKKLQELDLSFNQMIGAIPLSVSYQLSLQTVTLSNNSFSGCFDRPATSTVCQVDSYLCGCTRAGCGPLRSAHRTPTAAAGPLPSLEPYATMGDGSFLHL
jgi:LRR receptor-like serine/threonine-protein kinase FLS2